MAGQLTRTELNRNNEGKQPFLVLDLRRNICIFSAFIFRLAVGFQSWILKINRCWTLFSLFSTAIEIIVCVNSMSFCGHVIQSMAVEMIYIRYPT